MACDDLKVQIGERRLKNVLEVLLRNNKSTLSSPPRFDSTIFVMLTAFVKGHSSLTHWEETNVLSLSLPFSDYEWNAVTGDHFDDDNVGGERTKASTFSRLKSNESSTCFFSSFVLSTTSAEQRCLLFVMRYGGGQENNM